MVLIYWLIHIETPILRLIVGSLLTKYPFNLKFNVKCNHPLGFR